jgi:hypothetical protein
MICRPPHECVCVVCGKCLVCIWAGTIIITAKACRVFRWPFRLIQAYSGKYLQIGHDRFLSRPFFLIYYSLPFSHSHTFVSSRECFRIIRIVCRDMIIIQGPAREAVVYASRGSYSVLKHSQHCIGSCWQHKWNTGSVYHTSAIEPWYQLGQWRNW